MRRRLRLLALAISAISIAAFLVPLLLSLKRYERTTALAAASQTANDVASIAARFADDQTRLQNSFLLAYAGTPYDVTVWYPDGRGLSLSPQGAQPGTMPADLRAVSAGAPGVQYRRDPVAGGYRVLAGGPWGLMPAQPAALDDAPLVAVFVPTSELTRGTRSQYVSFGIVAVVIVLGSVVVADRVAAMRPPSNPSTPARSREPAPV